MPAPLLASTAFDEHAVPLAFGLQRDAAASGEARRWRTSSLKLLQGWGQDSNGGAGAVMKGWVERRFGIVPWFHKAPLARFPSPAWVDCLTEKGSSRWQNNCFQQQLDLPYEFCQWSLSRWRPFGAGQHLALWRATSRADEQLIEGALRQGAHAVMRLNNLPSFALQREQAFYPGLLRAAALSGECEVLAIGGDCEVELAHA